VFFNTGSFDVSTPQISTLFRVNSFPPNAGDDVK
jgi:hypothetical protein